MTALTESPTSLCVKDLQQQGRQRLSAAGIPEPAGWTDWLLTDLLRTSHCELTVRANEPVTTDQGDRFNAMLDRAAAHEPPQYIVGEVEFLGCTLACDARALIPRPETEQWVAQFVRDTRWQTGPRPIVADIGTGSGAIAVALATCYPAASYWALEAAQPALELAAHNVIRHACADRVTVLASDGVAALPDAALIGLVANLPYLTTAEWSALPRHIRDYEPRSALDGGPDGLDVIRSVVATAPRVLRPQAVIYLEIGARQGSAVAHLLAANGFAEIHVHRDWGGHDRVVTGRWS